MVRPERELLSGVVELDQSFLGGRSHGKAGASTEKAPITIAVERLPSGRLGRARLALADMPNGVDQLEFAREVIAPGTEIHTDGAWVLTRLSDHRTWFPRQIADGRNDILAEAAGITAGSWYASPATHVGYELIGAGMLILARGRPRSAAGL